MTVKCTDASTPRLRIPLRSEQYGVYLLCFCPQYRVMTGNKPQGERDFWDVVEQEVKRLIEEESVY